MSKNCLKLYCNHKTKQGFISLYALLITLAISLSALHTIRTLAIKKDITLALYFQKQAYLYAKTLHSIAIQCYKQYNEALCRRDLVQFDPYFYGEYIFHEAAITSNNQTQTTKVKVLDISIYSQTLLSTHPLRYARRYILKGAP